VCRLEPLYEFFQQDQTVGYFFFDGAGVQVASALSRSNSASSLVIFSGPIGDVNTARLNQGCPTTLQIAPEPLPAGTSGPLIESMPPTAAVVGAALQYQVVTSYSLSSAPAGMTIGATSGLVQWTPASSEAGDQQIVIMANDSVGQTSQSFTLSVFGTTPAASALIFAKTGGTIMVSNPSSPINGLSISVASYRQRYVLPSKSTQPIS
jgi:hypothetical protein